MFFRETMEGLSNLRGTFHQAVAHVLSTLMMAILLAYAAFQTNNASLSPQLSLQTIAADISVLEPVSSKIEDYLNANGFESTKFTVLTKDEFILSLYRIRDPSYQGPSKGPVLLLHGLFQDSGVFVTSGKESIAFVLARAGYDVWLGNNRCIESFSSGFGLKTNGQDSKTHLHLGPSDFKYWDWSLDELARFDFPSLLEFVYTASGRQKVIFIGHSQGNAQAFMSLCLTKEGEAILPLLKCLIALAPAAFLGPLLEQGPVSLLMDCPPKWYWFLFGRKQILPIMDVVQYAFPSRVFAACAYTMFHYLFSWTNTNWDKARVSHYFRFTPRPTSTKAILHWSQMAHSGFLTMFDPACPTKLDYEIRRKKHNHSFGSHSQSPSQPDSHSLGEQKLSFQSSLSRLSCPLIMFYGRQDLIVDGDRLERACRSHGLDVLYSEHVSNYEHMDVLWATSAPERVFSRILKELDSL